MLGNLPAKEKEDLETIIKKSIETTGVLKETDLAKYIPHGDGSLPKQLFMHFKARNKNMLAVLIKENILDKEPRIYSSENHSSSITSTYSQTDLEEVIEKAMKKLNIEKESEICPYLPDGNKRLHHFTYEKKKKTNPAEIAKLIQTNILDKAPQRLDRTYRPRKSTSSEITKAEGLASEETSDTLQQVIDQAMKRRKLGIEKESDLCWYIPAEEGGYLYYSTFRSLKQKDPQKLEELIRDHIISPKKPKKFPPNPRKSTLTPLSSQQTTPLIEQNSLPSPKEETQDIDTQLPKIEPLQQLLSELLQEIRSNKVSYMHSSNPQNAYNSLTDEIPTNMKARISDSLTGRYFRTIQNQLIKKIRQKEVDFELWDAFVDFIEHEKRGFS